MIFRYGPGLWAAIYVHIAGERENGAPGLRGREGVLCESRDKTRPLRIRSVRGMDDDIRSAGRLDHRFLGEEIRLDDLRPGGKPSGSRRRANDGPNVVAREAGSSDDGPADGSSRPEDDNPHAPATRSPSIRLTRPEARSPTCTMHARGRVIPASPGGPSEPASVRRTRCERWEETASNWGRGRRSSWSSCWRRVRWAS